MATAKRINEPLALTPLAGLGAVILTGILWGTIGVVTGQLKAAFPGVDGGPSTLSSLVLVVVRLGITAPAAAITARILLGRGAFRLPGRVLALGVGLGLAVVHVKAIAASARPSLAGAAVRIIELPVIRGTGEKPA